MRCTLVFYILASRQVAKLGALYSAQWEATIEVADHDFISPEVVCKAWN